MMNSCVGMDHTPATLDWLRECGDDIIGMEGQVQAG